MANKVEEINKTTKKPTKRQKQKERERLTPKEKIFCREYVKLSNGKQAAIKAGYSERTAVIQANQILSRRIVQREIERLSKKREEKALVEEDKAIADSIEVMGFLTKVMRGEVKDQFGLDPSLADRIKAGQELAKRTIDIDNKMKGLPDANVTIKLDWDD